LITLKSNRNATSPSHALFPPKASNLNFEINILFKIVQILYNNASRFNKTLQGLGARVVSYAPRVYKIFTEVVVVYTLEEAYLIGN
jgi:hypothetical protein